MLANRLGRFRRFPGSPVPRFYPIPNWESEPRFHSFKESGTRKRRFRNRDPIPKAGSGKIPGSGDRLGSNWNTLRIRGQRSLNRPYVLLFSLILMFFFESLGTGSDSEPSFFCGTEPAPEIVEPPKPIGKPAPFYEYMLIMVAEIRTPNMFHYSLHRGYYSIQN